MITLGQPLLNSPCYNSLTTMHFMQHEKGNGHQVGILLAVGPQQAAAYMSDSAKAPEQCTALKLADLEIQVVL